ncbi:MAG: hypothetical protein ACREVE_16080 [Gammaproteobacteria bacterium]
MPAKSRPVGSDATRQINTFLVCYRREDIRPQSAPANHRGLAIMRKAQRNSDLQKMATMNADPEISR